MSDAVQLPMGWAWAAVSDVAIDLRYGTSAKTASDINGVPVLRMGNLTSNGEIILDEFKFLPADHPDLAGASLSVGDILFNRTNSFELVGKSAVYLGNPDPCSFASYLIRLRLNPTCLPKYLAFALNSHLGKAWVKKVVSQQVGQANVNGTKLRSFTFPLPPLAEQRRIVAEIENQFTRLDAAVAALRRAKTRLRHFRAVVLHLACGPKEGWKKTQLLDAIDEIRNGISVKPTKAEGIPILRISSVRPMTVNLQDVRFLPDAPEYNEVPAARRRFTLHPLQWQRELRRRCRLRKKLERGSGLSR